MQFTNKYHFRKPDGPDTYNVQDFNANWDLAENVFTQMEQAMSEDVLTPEAVVAAIDEAVNLGMVVNVNRLDRKASAAFATAEQGAKAEAALPRAGGTMTGSIAMGNKPITGLPSPANAADAANKSYVDDAIKRAGVDAVSSDSSSFPWYTWLEKHWSEIEDGVRTFRVLHNADGSVSTALAAKKNNSNGACLIVNNFGGARAVYCKNGSWSYRIIGRNHSNDLGTNDSEATLSAAQGKTLNDKINALASRTQTLEGNVKIILGSAAAPASQAANTVYIQYI